MPCLQRFNPNRQPYIEKPLLNFDQWRGGFLFQRHKGTKERKYVAKNEKSYEKMGKVKKGLRRLEQGKDSENKEIIY